MQQMRLTATSMLLTSIQINQLIRDAEADSGTLAASSGEDAELEDDDGSSLIAVRLACRVSLYAASE